MDPERWQRAKQILNRAIDLPFAEQFEFIKAACGDDSGLFKEVRSLLEADEADLSFMDKPFGGIIQPNRIFGPGEKIGHFRIVRELGRGGMGTVYLAERDDYQQQVALKLLKRGMDTDEIVRRFRNERRILARLNHPNIAKIFDGGSTREGLPFFAMEYVDGEPLLQFCNRRHWTIRQRLQLFKKICAAVQHAHRNLIIHRDLKPSNILITVDGEPKLLDFGIAKILPNAPSEDISQTLTGLRLMTPDYASPEQASGALISTATDIYSLGVVLYELLTGAKPYALAQRTPLELKKAICEVKPEKPSVAVARLKSTPVEGEETGDSAQGANARRSLGPGKLGRTLRGDLDNILLTALRKEPDRRYASAQEFAEDIDRYLEGFPIRARRETFFYSLRKFSGRHRWAVLAGALAVAGLVAFSIAIQLKNSEIARQRNQAERVVDFMTGIFEKADPYAASKAEMTATELLDEAITKIDTELVDEPQVRADLLRAMGWAYSNLGNLDPAIAKISESLELQIDAYGNQHPKVARAASNLGSVLLLKGKVQEAETYLTQADAIYQNTGADPARLGELNRNMGLLLYKKGDYPRAIEKFEACLRAFERQGNDTLVVWVVTDLATLYSVVGRYDDAIAHYRKSLERQKQLPMAETPFYSGVLQNLANVYFELGRLQEAEKTAREAFEVDQRLFDPDHFNLGYSHNLMGIIAYRTKRYDEAESCFKKALAIWEKSYGLEHADTLTVMSSLGNLAKSRGDYDEAERMQRRVLDIREKVVGTEHIDYANSLATLADLAHLKGETEKALAMVDRALAIRKAAVGEEHLLTAISHYKSALYLLALGRHQEALIHAQPALDIRKEILDPGHERIVEVEDLLRQIRMGMDPGSN